MRDSKVDAPRRFSGGAALAKAAIITVLCESRRYGNIWGLTVNLARRASGVR